MKKVLEQIIVDFEDTMKELKEDVGKKHSETAKAISDLQQKVVNTIQSSESQAKSRKNQPTPSSSTTTSQPSPKTRKPATTPVPPPDTAKSSLTTNKENNAQPKRRTKTEYQRKPRILLFGDSVGHNTNFRKLEHVTNTTLKTSEAYSSARDKDARFKRLNVTDVVKNELGSDTFAPTVDISKLDTSKVKP